MGQVGESTTTVPALVAEGAARYPVRNAIVDGDRTWTYRDLAADVRRAAAAFINAGIAPGDRVAIWAPNSAGWILAMLGLVSAGGVLVPLNTRYRGREAADILSRSRARLLVTVDEFLGQNYPAMLADEDLAHLDCTVLLEGKGGIGWEDFVEKGASDPDALQEADRRAGATSADDQLDLMFTSGTTGQPKGVPSRHGPAVRAYSHYARTLGIIEGDRYLLVNPLFHSFGAKAGVLAALSVGATLYPVPIFEPAAAAELIEAAAITVFPGPPTIYHSLLQLPPEHRPALDSLRLAVTGAAVVPVELVERMRDTLGFDTVLTAYGLTEAGGLVTMCQPSDDLETIAGTCGRAVPGMEIAVFDDSGASLPPGQPGEVVVRGYAVMDGYYEDPTATAENIDSAGWLHTGDIGFLDDAGYLRITDRKKDMYITGGFNVYPAEVEEVLVRHGAISQAAIVGVADQRLGEVGHAYVVPIRGATVDPADVIAWARVHLANFKAPRRVTVVDELPVNASGKVQKFKLREWSTTEEETRGGSARR